LAKTETSPHLRQPSRIPMQISTPYQSARTDAI
ncbi:hypothetical protein T11_11925, partial [Trichinella zimbabwensis]